MLLLKERLKLCRADHESDTSHIGWIKHRILVQRDQLFGPFWSGIGYRFLENYVSI